MQHLGEEKQGGTGDIFLKSTSIRKLTLYNVIGKKIHLLCSNTINIIFVLTAQYISPVRVSEDEI